MDEIRSWTIVPASPGWQLIVGIRDEDFNVVVDLEYYDIIAWRIDNDPENGKVEPITADSLQNQGRVIFSTTATIIMPPTGRPIVPDDYLLTREKSNIIAWFNEKKAD